MEGHQGEPERVLPGTVVWGSRAHGNGLHDSGAEGVAARQHGGAKEVAAWQRRGQAGRWHCKGLKGFGGRELKRKTKKGTLDG